MLPEDKEAGLAFAFFLLNRCSFVHSKEGKLMGELGENEKFRIAV